MVYHGDVALVCPVHDEAAYLAKTLPSFYALEPSEVVFLLDNCKDDSARIIFDYVSTHNTAPTRIYEVGKNQDGYAERLAYLFRLGYSKTHSPCIMNVAADLKMDPAIKGHLSKLGQYNLLTFGFVECNIQGVARLVYHGIRGTHYGGISAFWKTDLALEDVADLKTGRLREDRHLIETLAAQYPSKHIPTLTHHLRPRPHNWGRWIKLDGEII